MKRNGAFVAILCLATLLSVPALAETKKEKARRLFDEGIAALDAHNYKKALRAFDEAYATSPHWAVLGLIGTCNAKMARPVESIAALEKYLEEGGSDIPAEERRSARKLLLEERKKVGHLFLVIKYPKAEVKVDGDSIGKAPFERITLRAGVHHVVVVDGDNVMERDITVVARKEHTMRFPEEDSKPTPVPVATPPQPEPEPEPEPETEPEPDPFAVEDEPEKERRSGTSGPFWVSVAFIPAGVIAAGLGIPMWLYNQNSSDNYASQITGDIPGSDGDNWSNYSWADNCNSGQVDPNTGDVPVTGGSSGVYFCETERSRIDFEEKADKWKIVGLVGGGVAVLAIPVSIIFYKHPQWFVDAENAKLRVTPVAGPSFSGLSLNGTF